MRIWHHKRSSAYLGINSKAGCPTLWRDDLADSIFASLWSNFLDVVHRVSELILSWSERRGILQAVGSNSLVGLAHSHWVTPLLHCRHVKRWRSPSAEWNMSGICGIAAILGGLPSEVDLKRSTGRRWVGCSRCGGGDGGGRVPTTRGWDWHCPQGTSENIGGFTIALKR